MKINNPTISLLTASVMISFSGAFRIAIAYLLIGAVIDLWNVTAGFLIIYATYTFDRIIGGEEDEINRSELLEARKDIVFVVCVLSFIAGAFILFLDDLLLVSFIPFTVGALYSKGLKLGSFRFRLKGGLGSKNLTVGLTWGAFIAGIVLQGNHGLVITSLIFSFFFVKTFINTVINDVRDMEGDQVAGLMTLPIYLGEKNTKSLLMLIHVIEHTLIILTMILGILQFEAIIILSCLLSGIIYIALFIRCPTKAESRSGHLMHHIFYKWEFYVAMGLRTASSMVV